MFNFIHNTPENFVGGKIKAHKAFWETLTSDKEILKCVEGVEIRFEKHLMKSIFKKEFLLDEEELASAKEEVQSFLDKKIIRKLDYDKDTIKKYKRIQFVTNIFLRKKQDGSFRTILNLKHLNRFVEKIHFKMETLRSTLKLVYQNCYFCRIDLKDAYYSVPLGKSSRRFFRFVFGEQIYEFVSLPQGYTDSPRIFTKLTKPLLARLRANGFINSIYIDDLLLISQNEELCNENVQVTSKLLDDAGFTIHPHKSEIKATQAIEFLGFIIDSKNFHVRPTAKRVIKVTDLGMDVLKEEQITIQRLSQLIGSFVALEQGNTYAPIFYKRIEIFRNKQLRKNYGNYEAIVKVTDEVKEDILWWMENMDKFPKKIRMPEVTLIFKCDASQSGWGIYDVQNNKTSNGSWSAGEREFHINCLELLAIKICLQTFAKYVYDQHIKIFSDNTTAVRGINKMGSVKEKLNNIIREIWLWCKIRNIFITVVHIAGKKNIEADRASREFNENLEWSLNDAVFESIKNRFGEFTIDLFASRINYKVKNFISWRPDPLSSYVDAFSVKWDFKLCFCHPPYNLIASVLQKIEFDEAEVVLVFPLWHTQYWFPKLLNLLVDYPVFTSCNQDTLMHPIFPKKIHPLYKKLNLSFGRLSGKAAKTKAFQNKLQRSSCRVGGKELLEVTTLTSENGQTFVINGKLIPFLPLRTI